MEPYLLAMCKLVAVMGTLFGIVFVIGKIT